MARCGRFAVVALLAVLSWPDRACAEIELRGLNSVTETSVRASLGLADEPCNAVESRIRRLFKNADSEIRQTLEVYGYYSTVIRKQLEWKHKCWMARFDVELGPRVLLRKVTVRITGAGQDDPELKAVLANRPFRRDDGLNQREYEQFKQSIASVAQQRGFFDGRFAVSTVDVFPAERAADVTIEYDSGPRYRFGPVEIEQDVIEAGLAGRFVEFHTGDPFDANEISSLYRDLLGAGYFQGVDIRTTPRPAPDLDVLVTIRLTPSKPRTWSIGAGYATDTGLRVRLGYLNQRLNDAGHQLEFNATESRVLGDTTASYRLPWGRPRDEWLSFGAGYRYENPGDRRSDIYQFGVRSIKRRPNDWRETRFIDYSHERDEIAGVVGTTDLVVPGITWSHQTDQAPMRPLNAHRVALQLIGTDPLLGSDTQFLQLDLSGKLINPLWSGARLLTRGEVGYTIKDDFRELPFSRRFFAGGDTSVRGYSYKSLGPAVNDQVVGGTDLLVGSVEVDQKILPDWSLAAFVDVGNAFDQFQSMNLKTGVGVGIRWHSPLGAIRVDIAFPTANDAPDSYRLHVTLGPDL